MAIMPHLHRLCTLHKRVQWEIKWHDHRLGRCKRTPVDAEIDLGHHASVHYHVNSKEASVLVHHRCREVEEEEGGRLSVGSDYSLQHTHQRLSIPAGVLCHHIHLHTNCRVTCCLSQKIRCVHALTYARSKQVGVLARANTCTHLLCFKVHVYKCLPLQARLPVWSMRMSEHEVHSKQIVGAGDVLAPAG